ncbi:hypothetical protein C8J55DRAFT_520787 [Lentinula edodes]|uniref:DUF6533 domain-containing protein n=1 Tax=Lentinula lateritia TaxID=40482 RepID=A0A9W9A1W2_9AGAR|nr:hypothetical protein C8J55DRAFT_520787 [Lentinula edodes]
MPSPDLLKAIIASLEGSEIARIVNIACLALSVYEWLITLDQEIEYFWTGKWTISRILFFLNRYIPPFLVMLGLIEFSIPNPSDEFCISAIRFSFVSSILALGTIQAMLILRIWYLFPHNKFIQYGMVILWVFSVAISLAYTSVAAMGLRLPNTSLFMQGAPGCRVARPVKFWRMFMPSLGLHTILYIMTAVRALRNRRILKDAPVLKRLLRDGGLFFFVVFVSIGFTAIGSFLENVPQINIPVIFSNYLLAVTSIAMSRIMFSIHSLASHLGSETGWLLSNVELRRTNWRKGATEGELIVECNSYDDYDDRESNLQINNGSLRSYRALKVSRVGVFNDDTMWL